MSKTGLKPAIDQEQINRIQAKRDLFGGVQSKIKEKINMGTSQAVMEIREQIKKDKAQKELSFIMQTSQHAVAALGLTKSVDTV
jgi:hypothetical protein